MEITNYINYLGEKASEHTAPYWVKLAYEAFLQDKYRLILTPNKQVYLARFWLSEMKLAHNGIPISSNSLLLHHFVQPDPDRHLHDHPQKFICTVLSGGYTEELGSLDRRLNPGMTNIIPAKKCHRISAVDPDTWSLVNTGPKEKSWGFCVDGEMVNYREYLGIES